MSESYGRADDITVYLKRLSAGDNSAEAPLADAVYAHMRYIARRALQGEERHMTLDATALANEVLFECARLRTIDWRDREHFFRTAGRMLRRRVIDYIREQRAGKRPPREMRDHLDEVQLPAPDRFDEVLHVHKGLQRLKKFDPGLADLIEMIYFGGLTIADAARIRGVSEKTIDRQLDLARRWLKISLFPPARR